LEIEVKRHYIKFTDFGFWKSQNDFELRKTIYSQNLRVSMGNRDPVCDEKNNNKNNKIS
jgi:hypothetical protein